MEPVLTVNFTRLLTLLVLLQLTFASTELGKNVTKTQWDLYAKLFENYNPEVLPVIDNTKPINVELSFFLHNIHGVDERKQQLSVRVMLEIKWKDETLVWNPEIFGGFDIIPTQVKNIWIPDVSLGDVIGLPTDLGQVDNRAIINHEGLVVIWPYKIHTIGCKMSIAKFPFDEHSCMFRFVSWTNPSSKLKLYSKQNGIFSQHYTGNSQWEIVETNITNFKGPTFYNRTWDNVKFIMKIRRKWLFHALNMIAPVVCVSLLNVFCFILPVSSGERITLCISIFLTLAVFLTIVTDSMPQSSDEVSSFSVYICLQLLGAVLAILMTVISIYCSDKKTSSPVPLPLRIIVHIFFKTDLDCEAEAESRNVKNEIINTIISNNGKVEDTGVKNDAALTLTQQPVTWSMVSIAIDRMCMIGAFLWHAILGAFLYLSFAK